ncbi:MAG TPA: hypothetical protein ENN84_02170 [Candidatus Marinimicrobia bacterium]|nr:hypothetical protein [Candidatus Neomarinimicrobiota bacterium]
MHITNRQQEILDYLKAYYTQYHSSPTHQEMANHFGLKAKSTIFKHLKALERKGLIQNDFNRNQAVRVLTDLTPKNIKSYNKILNHREIEAVTDGDLKIFPMNIEGHQLYLVETEIFRGEGIIKGDLIALAKQSDYQSGDYLLLRRNDGELRLGYAEFPEEMIIAIRFQRKGSLPEYYDASDIEIIGKVFQLYRHF